MLTISFFGHRELSDPHLAEQLENKLTQLITTWINEQAYVEFLIGRNGEFDRLATSVIRRCQKTVRHDNNALVLVLPYSTAEYRNNETAFRKFYDEIDFVGTADGQRTKSAFRIRNQTMIDRSDFVVCFVEHSIGGAHQALCYAIKTGRAHINLKDHMDK